MPVGRDVFHWKMSAAPHKESVDSLRIEIIHAYQNQLPVPISLIFALLPLDTDQADEAQARGNFEFDGDLFRNEAANPLWIEFRDPVLKTFNMTIPEIWGGTIQLVGEKLTIRFDPAIEWEIPRLTELGVDRTAFQIFESIEADPQVSITILRDKGSPSKETWIEARLDPSVPFRLEADSSVSSIVTFDTAEECSHGDPEEPNWYVYRRRDQLCIVHYGTIAIGGQLQYQYRFGPAKKSECERWRNRECNPTCPDQPLPNPN